MWKDKVRKLSAFFVKNSKIAFPILVVVAVAITVFVALNEKNKELLSQSQEDYETLSTESATMEILSQEQTLMTAQSIRPVTEESLLHNTSPEIVALVTEFFTAKAQGDLETIRRLRTVEDETDELKIEELSKYIESFPWIEIYTKPGPYPDTYLAFIYFEVSFEGQTTYPPGTEWLYICTQTDGSLIINNAKLTDEEKAYFSAISEQADVIALYDEVNYKYMVALINDPTLEAYVDQVGPEVEKAVGEKLALRASADQETDTTEPQDGGTSSEPAADTQSNGMTFPRSATALTTVRIRSSDSEQADQVGRVTSGEKLQVLEQRANGWSRVLYDNTEGYIKSEYLELQPLVEGGAVIGTVTATSNVNIRSAASETGDKLGIVTNGDTMDLISREDGWCKISYNGIIGYVKESFVR
ncbi:MAG: SH3 domain-containing protein [Lachnospiraceae bacterium]|jgi:uncharacterized protein YgiM (DUF1202 family)|nr:SH3 domain-containing protein [Lachnospiraceae bacterium]